MTIKIYPSRLPGEPLETHEHDRTTLHAWFRENVTDYRLERDHPVVVEVNGHAIAPSAWPEYSIKPDDEVKIYPVPYGSVFVIAVWAVVSAVVATTAYAMFAMQGEGNAFSSIGSGKSLELSPAKANSVALGDPIREVFGKYRIYPDYIMSPVGRYDANDPEKYVMHLFLCLGAGTFSFSEGDIRVGATPVGSLKDNFSYRLFTPDTNVTGDSRTENWYTSSEVGGTNSSTGLDMGTTAPDMEDINAQAVTVSGATVSFTGLTTDDNAVSNKLPESWTVGATIELVVPDSFSVTTDGQFDVISGNTLAEIAPYVGMPVALTYNSITYTLFIAGYTPAAEGIAASVTLAYGSATGTAFSGIPNGIQQLAINHLGNQYKILNIDGTSLILARIYNGAVDNIWPGFNSRTALDFQATGINDSNSWLGPFLACPENEKTDCFEVNFSFPSGICGFDKKGKKKNRTVNIELQYRIYGSGEGWTTKAINYTNKSINGLGYTERIALRKPGLVEVRCRRTNEQGKDNSRDSAYWQALRSRLPARPSSYAGVTTMAVSVVTGGKLAAQSDRRINVVVTRNYRRGTARTISGALYHVLDGLGLPIDTPTIESLEASFWTPRAEYFDYCTGQESTTVLEMLRKITNAGMGYFLLSDGLASAGREGIKAWTGVISPQETTEPLQTAFSMPSKDDFDGVDVCYINGTTWAEETVHCRTSDNPTPEKVESYKLDGVVDTDRAYRIGMRRLMGYKHQKLSHSMTTELDALCYQFMDRIVLTDDIPGSDTISCLVTEAKQTDSVIRLTVTEPLNWSFNNPRCLLRLQDGRATPLLIPARVDEFTLTIPLTSELYFNEWIMDDPNIEPPRLIFCSSEHTGYDALISDISPSPDGTCEVLTVQYTPLKYQYDDAHYPGDKT
ncbi:host specificity factor TipJ family phage tail protein [Pantoea osteomyelitidis]|uniref:Host specificity factor TipJ family phage tail protein n=2 Tax=Pantoea osteomyelitidis TaxID=3230026 RepID=A0ABW7PVF3_9GAMM